MQLGLTIRAPDPSAIAQLARQAVLALDSPSSQRNYQREITLFLASGAILTRSSVLGYVQGLKQANKGASGIRVALAAIRLLARESNERGLVDDATMSSLDSIRAPKVQGVRLGNWLTVEQCRELLDIGAAASRSPTRDKALIACMLGCGLRREETVSLTRDQYQIRAGRPVWVNLGGKGNKSRSVPVCRWAATLIEQWLEESKQRKEQHNNETNATNNTSTVATSLALPTAETIRSNGVGVPGRMRERNTNHVNGDRVFAMTAQNAYLIVAQCASRVGMPNVRPHDLRRTMARRLYEAGADLEQLRQVLGHSSLQVTMRYVGAGVELAQGKAVVDLFELTEGAPDNG